MSTHRPHSRLLRWTLCLFGHRPGETWFRVSKGGRPESSDPKPAIAIDEVREAKEVMSDPEEDYSTYHNKRREWPDGH